MIDLKQLMDKARSLRPLPVSATKLAALVAKADTELREVVEVAELDQALTARLLRAANSVSSAAAVQVRTVKDAVVRLGASSVLAMAVSVAVREQMTTALPEYGLAEDALWRHSVATALATDAMAPYVRVRITSDAFASAILHDVGKLVIGRCALGTSIQESLQPGGQANLSKLETELGLLRTHHAALGGLAAQAWRLPSSIVKGILFHHEPHLGAATICDIVCVANQIAHSAIPVLETPREFSDEEVNALERLEMTDEGFRSTCNIVAERFEEVKARFE